MIPTQTETEDHTKQAMDRMYRLTRHVYDLSRKYYLLGRDRLIQNLKPKGDETVCEIGCGTARNLIKMAKRYPNAHFYGIDASDEMLKTASNALKKHGLHAKIPLAQGYAQNFDPAPVFGLERPFDKIVFSYALSIIPPWRESLDHALTLLPTGGQIHIVDFGGMENQPAWFRKLIFWWLSLFHVYHKPEIESYLKRLELEKQGTLSLRHLYRGYTYLAVFTKL